MKNTAFVLVEAQGRVSRCDLNKALTVVGSGDSCELFVPGSSVETRHAQFSYGDEKCWLRSIDEAPVTINGIELERAHELTNGDRIGVGDAELLYVDPPLVSPVICCLVIRRPESIELGCWSAQSTLSIGTTESDLPLLHTGLDGVELVLENFCVGGQFVVGSHEDTRLLINGSPLEGRTQLISGDVLRMADVEIQVTFGVSLWEAVPDHMKRHGRRNTLGDKAVPRFRQDSAPSGPGLRRPRRNNNSLLKRPFARVITGQTAVRQLSPADMGTVAHAVDPWYLPAAESSERSRLPRPIIRARGDDVPAEGAEGMRDTQDKLARDSSRTEPAPEKARIRRKQSPDSVSTRDLPRPRMDRDAPVAPGARDDARWYVPSKTSSDDTSQPRFNATDSRWYVPDSPSLSDGRESANRGETDGDEGFSVGRRRRGTRDYHESDLS